MCELLNLLVFLKFVQIFSGYEPEKKPIITSSLIKTPGHELKHGQIKWNTSRLLTTGVDKYKQHKLTRTPGEVIKHDQINSNTNTLNERRVD